ncbi:MAG: anthranilate phosphoribosyltransferase [Candidatus Omnitrophota bacterium]
MIKEAIAQLIDRKSLANETIHQAMEEIMTGQATSVQIAAFLVALRLKGETVDEITAAAEVMRRHVRAVKTDLPSLLDTCGTGGDHAGTFNISTISAFVAAGAGVVVAKHGNKCVSSKCGSADLLVALGVRIELEPAQIERCLKEVGFGFLFAPQLHPAMQYAAAVRREMGIRTIFNILGPLTNPAGARQQLLGVFSPKLTEVMAQVLRNLGSSHVIVVHGMDGLDEVTTTTKTRISELKNGKVRTYTISPRNFHLPVSKPDDLKGADSDFNARLALEILQGKKGPARDAVVLNSACAIYAADKAGSIEEGIVLAAQAIDSGRALEKLEHLKKLTQQLRS